MQNKIKMILCAFGAFAVFTNTVFAEDDTVFIDSDYYDTASVADGDVENVSADAISGYQVEGSLFNQITTLEQEKVLMQLEKERAQLNLDLDKLAAEKIKLNMEIENLSGRAEQQQQEIETERARLEAEAKRLESQKLALENRETVSEPQEPVVQEKPKEKTAFEKSYKLINVFGAGNQLQATIQDVATGQSRRVSVGKKMDGYTVKSISLDEGVVFTDGKEIKTLNVETRK
ncbi:MAG: type IV pilus biogenesis protein PilP [Alphaproteobacteria bacterium]|nr:type IV pilus biogenesis protein PilP [Alphaproteobacteria bacterium]